MVQLAYQLIEFDEETNERKIIENTNEIIKPNGYEIPLEASKIHGITTEKAIETGAELDVALEDFTFSAYQADCIVCHNVNFDMMILGGEYHRNLWLEDFDLIERKPKICTMLETMEFVGIWNSHFQNYKYPKLEELHYKLFGRKFENAHDAKNDVQATVDCFFELLNKGVIKI